jgi:hypothetical protein
MSSEVILGKVLLIAVVFVVVWGFVYLTREGGPRP